MALRLPRCGPPNHSNTADPPYETDEGHVHDIDSYPEDEKDLDGASGAQDRPECREERHKSRD